MQECIKYKPGTRPPAIRPPTSAKTQAHKNTRTQKNTKKHIKKHNQITRKIQTRRPPDLQPSDHQRQREPTASTEFLDKNGRSK